MKISYEVFFWISDLISRLKYETVSPWDHIQFHLPIILSLNVHGDSGITWNTGLIRVWSQISETLIKVVELRILEFRLEWIQYPHRMVLRTWWNSASLSPVSTWCASPIPSIWWLQMCPAESYSPWSLPLKILTVTAIKMRRITPMMWHLTLRCPSSSRNSSFVDGSLQEQPVEGRCFITYTLLADHRWGHSKEGEPELVIISGCKTRWSSRHDLLTHYLRVAATVNKPFRTQFQLSGNLLNNRETNAVVELKDVLGSVRFAATIICKADTDLLVAHTSCWNTSCQGEVELQINFWSCWRNATWREAVETWFQRWGSYLGSLLQAFKLDFWSFSRIYTVVCSNWRNLSLLLLLVHHILLGSRWLRWMWLRRILRRMWVRRMWLRRMWLRWMC